MSNDINSFCHAFLKCFICNNTNGNEHCLTSRFHLVVRLIPSPRMPRSIRFFFTRAGAKIQNWLEKGARDNKEHGRQAATNAYVFLFHGHIYSPGQVPAYGNVRGRIDKWFCLFLKASTSIINFFFLKSTILGALWYGSCSLSGIFRRADRLSFRPAYGKVSTGCQENSCKFLLV